MPAAWCGRFGREVKDAFPRFIPMTALASARRFQDLLAPDVAPSPYDFQTLFAGEGWLARRRSKRRFQLLKKLDPRIRPILRPEERVFFVTAGTTVSLAEHFFVGWAAYYLNRRALVFTTQRILLVQIDSRKRPRDLVSQLRYEQIASVSSTWNGICQVKLHRGLKLKFQGVARAERKFLHQFLSDIVQPRTGAETSETNHLEHLCPKCFAVVPGHPPSCSACGAPFKSAGRAALLSAIFPGLGDLYLGHRGFALLELFGSAFLWFVLVIAPLVAGGVIDEQTGELLPIDSSYWITVGIVVALAHTIDATMTHHFARKGHHPA